ncbi:MAG: hypothetical protein WBG50_08295 [Desulfomonilaceae bacterium]
MAAEKFRPYIGHKLLGEMEIDPDTAQFYYLTGARTVVFVGYAKSGMNLKRFYSSICFGTGIEATFYHAVEGWEADAAQPK